MRLEASLLSICSFEICRHFMVSLLRVKGVDRVEVFIGGFLGLMEWSVPLANLWWEGVFRPYLDFIEI